LTFPPSPLSVDGEGELKGVRSKKKAQILLYPSRIKYGTSSLQKEDERFREIIPSPFEKEPALSAANGESERDF
jgi:hypothetical protein